MLENAVSGTDFKLSIEHYTFGRHCIIVLQISEALKASLSSAGETPVPGQQPSPEVEFHSLQYALFTTNFVEVLGGLFFLFTAIYIVRDKENADREISGESFISQMVAKDF